MSNHDDRPPADDLFMKTFTYERERYRRSAFDSLFTAAPWCLVELATVAERLNATKSRLSDLDITAWHQHTNLTNVAGAVTSHVARTIHPELCTQAWCKFAEVVRSFPIVPRSADEISVFRSIHLCEAPGAFVASLNHYLKSCDANIDWQWLANTLNPYNESNEYSSLIDDDRLIAETSCHWLFGEDNTGDIMNPANANAFVSAANQLGDIHLVTADGSVDCADNPAEQESLVSQLLLCEIVASLRILSPGGSLVIKMFTLLEAASVCLMYLMYSAFENLSVHKPATSKPGNSEVYVIAVGFRGQKNMKLNELSQFAGREKSSMVMFASEAIGGEFLMQHANCCRQFARYQKTAIKRNLSLFHAMPSSLKEEMNIARRCCALEFVSRFSLREIDNDHRIVPLEHGKERHQAAYNYDGRRRRHEGSYYERQAQIHLCWRERLEKMAAECRMQTGSRVACFQVSTRLSRKGFNSQRLFQSGFWLNNMAVSAWIPVAGRRLTGVRSSKFADRYLLRHYNLMLDNLLSRRKDDACCQCPVSLTDMIVSQLVRLDQNDTVIRHASCVTPHSLLARLRDGHNDKFQSNDESHDGDTPSTLWWLESKPIATGEMSSVVESGTASWKSLSQMDPNSGDDCLLVTAMSLTRLTTAAIYMLHCLFEQVSLIRCGCRPELCVLATRFKGPSFEPSHGLVRCIRLAEAAMQNKCHTETETAIVQVIPVPWLSEPHFYGVIRAFNDDHLKERLQFLITQEKSFLQTVDASSPS